LFFPFPTSETPLGEVIVMPRKTRFEDPMGIVIHGDDVLGENTSDIRRTSCLGNFPYSLVVEATALLMLVDNIR
jgi:hypothetical protein